MGHIVDDCADVSFHLNVVLVVHQMTKKEETEAEMVVEVRMERLDPYRNYR